MLTSALEQKQELSSAVVSYNNMLPFPQPRWRYCHSTLNKLHSVVDEVTHLLEYICTHDEYITEHIQELWVEMRMLQLKEHSAIALVNTSITEVQRPFKAYWEYRKYLEVSNYEYNNNNSSNNNNVTQKVSSLYSGYTHFIEEHEELSSIFSKHDELIKIFVNNLHNQHQEETVFTQNEKSDLPEEIVSMNTNCRQSCSNESVKTNNDANVNVEVLILSCKDVQVCISRVARALIALCEPNLLSSSSSSLSFALLPNTNSNNASINWNGNLLTDNNNNVCKHSVNTKENKNTSNSFYDSEHMYNDNIWMADNNSDDNINVACNTNTTNPANSTTTSSFTEYLKIKQLRQENAFPIINNKNHPLSNTDVHMSSFESNDSNTTHDTIPHTLCKTQHSYSNHNINTNHWNNINNNSNINNNNDNNNNDKLHMSSTWQTKEMSKYSLRHTQEILEKGLHCIQVQLSELTQTQQEMINKIDTFVKNVLENYKSSDTCMETNTTTVAGMNTNETASTKTEAKHRAEIHALQATLFAWQESTKRLSHTLELTQTALRDEQARSSKVEEENKSLQCRIDELIASRRRYGASPEETKQNNMFPNATQNTNIKNNNHYVYDSTNVNYHDDFIRNNNNYSSNKNNNLECTPIAQASSTTIVGRTPIAQIRAGIQRRLEEVAELANSLERVKVSEKQQEHEEEHHEEHERENETWYDQQRYYVTKHVQDKVASGGNSVNGNKNCTSNTSAMNNNLQRSVSKSVSEVDVSISPLSQDDSVTCDDKIEYNNDDDDGCDIIDISEFNEDNTDKMETNHAIKKDNIRETLLTIAPQPSVKRHYDMNDAESVLQNAKRLLARLHSKRE